MLQSVNCNKELADVPGCNSSAIRVQDNQMGDYISLESQEIGEQGIDMPTLNPTCRSKPYRYMWGCGGWERAFFRGAVSIFFSNIYLYIIFYGIIFIQYIYKYIYILKVDHLKSTKLSITFS